MIRKLLLWSLLCPLLWACGNDDDYVYPNVIMELVDLQTDATGAAAYLITDNGTQWHLQPHEGLDALVPDTIYRTVSMYSPLSLEGGAYQEAIIYNAQPVISPLPKPEDKVEEIKTDPVTLQSIWRSGRYLNLIVQAKVKDQKHTYGFIENGLTQEADGTQTLHLTLYHDCNNDLEGFDSSIYLSVPLWAYEGILNKGDKVTFSLNTYKEGMTSRTFEY